MSPTHRARVLLVGRRRRLFWELSTSIIQQPMDEGWGHIHSLLLVPRFKGWEEVRVLAISWDVFQMGQRIIHVSVSPQCVSVYIFFPFLDLIHEEYRSCF